MNPTNAQSSPAHQASWATTWAYLGIAIGAANFILLLPRLLDVDEVGLVRLVAAGSLIFIKFAFFGLDTSAVRFLAGEEPGSSRYQSQWRLLLLLCVIGLFAAIGPALLILLKQWSASGVKSIGRNLAIFLILALCIGMLWQRFAESIAQVAGKTAQAAFWRDLAPRVSILIGAIGIALQRWDFAGLLILWASTYLIGAVWLNRSVQQGGLYAPPFGPLPGARQIRETLRFASYSFMGTAAATMQTTLDSIMLAALVGLNELGVYTPFAYAATLIMIPMRSLTAACYARFRQAVETADLKTGRTLYTDVSLLQLSASGLIFVLLGINLPILVSLLGEGAYAAGAPVLIILGMGFWFEAALGQPSQVILSSPHYRLHGFINTLSLPVGILLNFLLIPLLGGIGAALATAATLTLAAAVKAWLVWRQYRMHPFSTPYWATLGLLLFIFALNTVFSIERSPSFSSCVFRSAISCIFLSAFAWKLDLLPHFRQTLSRLNRTNA
ncbi:hypothetical protein DDZ13_01435 [Coraliomargarita sinensis]|uniref:Uncharacterized protein n=1 Tax=Coraliomargarita sinensis TaxID=2174842 RepID=A0A317ZMU2_9BACT|nr:polysaccharide biosynthesis C-terminal domain-containing protein [Coraliomargarita sinensis]PXA05563.1 hypothetical protein DDZ13_01435 [Coraliomargarita sinensis]